MYNHQDILLYDKRILFFRDNFLSLDVYYGEMTYELIEQREAYPIEKVFSKYTFRFWLYFNVPNLSRHDISPDFLWYD